MSFDCKWNPQLVIMDPNTKNMYSEHRVFYLWIKWDLNLNTSLAAPGALAHRLQRITACNASLPAKSKMAARQPKNGVDTFVQGTVVQGPLCPRDISPIRLLSKETLVQGDYCPRWKFETLRAGHIIFSCHFIINQYRNIQ